MPSNGHQDARTLRSRLTHPIIDADGHWLEYAPLMREEFRRIGGEAAAEALAIASDRIPNSLRMSLAERQRRRIGQESFWSSPCSSFPASTGGSGPSSVTRGRSSASTGGSQGSASGCFSFGAERLVGWARRGPSARLCHSHGTAPCPPSSFASHRSAMVGTVLRSAAG